MGDLIHTMFHAFWYAVGHWNIFPHCCDILLGS